MRKLIFCLLIILSSVASANLTDVEKSLKVFNAKSLQDDVKSKDKTNLNIDKMFDALEKFTELTKSEAPTESQIEQACRVAVLTYKNDPSQYAAEILLPAYQKYKKDFEVIFKKNKLCSESLKNAEREEESGNG